MRRALFVICVLHLGCGRFSFEDRPDGALTVDAMDAGADAFVCVPTNHDEDGDAVDDACDVCPHAASPQADSDGDRVGDACDPEPANARQRIAVFDPFESLAAPWTAVGGAVAQGGKLELGRPGEARFVSRPYVPGVDLFVVGGRTGAGGTGGRILSITVVGSTPARYYCELFDSGVATQLQFTYTFDGTGYMFGGTAPAAAQFMDGFGTLSFATSATTVECGSSWNNETLSASGTIPAIAVNRLLLYGENLDVTLDYFLQIHTDG